MNLLFDLGNLLLVELFRQRLVLLLVGYAIDIIDIVIQFALIIFIALFFSRYLDYH